MTTKRDNITYKLEKADESLRAAEMLMANKFYADAVSKIYYAVFYGVNAWLNQKNLNPKTHTGVKALFHKEFVYTGVVSKEQADLFDTLQAKRFEADYEDFPFINEETIPYQLDEAKKLIVLIKNRIQASDND